MKGSMIGVILSYFGYAKMPDAVVQLATSLRMELRPLGEDHDIYKMAKCLEEYVRTAKYLTRNP